MTDDNVLYYGDNLKILREHVPDEIADVIYLDPPFKSNQEYNVLFREESGERAAAQIQAFQDTWKWDDCAAKTFHDVVVAGGEVSRVMQSFESFLRHNDMLAYLAMMAPRLVELRRVLKSTGSIFLHCDPTASHHLKLLMDAVFGVENFRNEIVWKRAQPKSHNRLRLSRAHDVILFYTKTDDAKYYQVLKEHDPEYLKKFYKYVEKKTGRRYALGDLTNPNKNRPNLEYEFPPKSGSVRVWRWTKERMKTAWKEGRVILPKGSEIVREKRYLDEMEGTPITDWWDDIEHLHGSHSESLGYPTQKPEALLERIIEMSTDKDDLVLDPFCGCGTAVAVAQGLDRRWIGIDITHLAITLIKQRLRDTFGRRAKYQVVGVPVSLPDARKLAEQDKYQFQWWALDLVDAKPAPHEQKKGADRGIDGRRVYRDGPDRAWAEIIFSVKGGHVSVKDVRDLRGVIEREKAAIGVLITLEKPTQQMRAEATAAGYFQSSWKNGKLKQVVMSEHPRLQIMTIAELMEGRSLNLPALARMSDATFKKAPRAKGKRPEAESLALDNDDD